MKRIALVPAYEPDMKMIETLKELREEGFEIVIVNDGSDWLHDDVFAKASEYGTVIAHMENKGKGAAIKTGLTYIRDHFEGTYTVVTIDADGQHKTADAVRCYVCSEDMPDALILGSRQAEKGSVKVPWESRLGNALTRFVFRLRAGVSINDTQTGLRAFSNRLLDVLLGIQGDRYEYEMNMLLYFADEKIAMIEVPISKIYINENESSHFDPLKDSLRIYKCIFKVPDIFKFGLCKTHHRDYILCIQLDGSEMGDLQRENRK